VGQATRLIAAFVVLTAAVPTAAADRHGFERFSRR